MRDKKDNSKKRQKSSKKDPPPFEEAFDRCFPEWCESLDSYMEIINFARSEEYCIEADEYTEVHHIVPKSWYEKHGYKIDNSEKNTVRLRMRDHYKVHFYARLCCESEVKRSLQCAFNMMGNILKCDVPEEWLDEKALLVEVQKVDKKFGVNGWKGKTSPMKGRNHTEESRKKMSESRKGKPHPHKGGWHQSEEFVKRHSEVLTGHPTSEETKKKISESMKGENHPNYGKHLSEETRSRISMATKGKVASNRKCEHCLLTDPYGQTYDVYDLVEFCKVHFEKVRSAKDTLRQYGSYKGWTYEIIEKKE